MIERLVLLGILCASVHWLVARSQIAKPLWSHATGWVDGLLRCAGCSGWWLGLLWGLAPTLRPVEHGVVGWLVTGVLGAFVTPVFEAFLLWGLEASTLEDTDDSQKDNDRPDPRSPH